MSERVWRLGVVSYLNACPLVEDLIGREGIELCHGVPAALPELLFGGQVDAAMIPVIDFLGRRDVLDMVSDACIGSDGATMTVRVFSPVPPEEVEVLRVDGDSHTSVALAQVLWSGYYHRRLVVSPLAAGGAAGPGEAVLLIGDKVVAEQGRGVAYDIDLGALWKEWTGLPFVFASWVARKGAELGELPAILGEARDRGVARAESIARSRAAEHGWPEELACEYLTRRIKYTMGAKYMEGMTLFFELALKLGIGESAGAKPRELVH